MVVQAAFNHLARVSIPCIPIFLKGDINLKVEYLAYTEKVLVSSPECLIYIVFKGEVAEWLKAEDCKSFSIDALVRIQPSPLNLSI